jgi:hypothetical protein
MFRHESWGRDRRQTRGSEVLGGPDTFRGIGLEMPAMPLHHDTAPTSSHDPAILIKSYLPIGTSALAACPTLEELVALRGRGGS